MAPQSMWDPSVDLNSSHQLWRVVTEVHCNYSGYLYQDCQEISDQTYDRDQKSTRTYMFVPSVFDSRYLDRIIIVAGLGGRRSTSILTTLCLVINAYVIELVTFDFIYYQFNT